MHLLLIDYRNQLVTDFLVIPYYPKEKTKGGVYIPDATRDRESFATVVAYVVKMDSDAYKDTDKFPTGAYCSEKEWVLWEDMLEIGSKWRVLS